MKKMPSRNTRIIEKNLININSYELKMSYNLIVISIYLKYITIQNIRDPCLTY